MHFEYICDAVSHQIMRLGVNTGTPVVFGVLTCLTEDQALARAGLPTSDGKNDDLSVGASSGEGVDGNEDVVHEVGHESSSSKLVFPLDGI